MHPGQCANNCQFQKLPSPRASGNETAVPAIDELGARWTIPGRNRLSGSHAIKSDTVTGGSPGR